jgi:hypothetical protein
MNFFSKYKKIFFIILFLAATIFIGYLLWRIFFQGNGLIGSSLTATTTANTGTLPNAANGTGQIVNSQTGGTIPSNGGTSSTVTNNSTAPNPNTPSNIAVGGLTKTTEVVAANTLSDTLSSSGLSVQYYNKDDGYFYKVGSDGVAVKMSDQIFHDVQNVTWAPDKNQAIIEYPDGSKILYNFATGEQITYPKFWDSISFSPQSDQVVAKSIGLDVENRFITVASTNGSNVKNIEAIGANADSVQTVWSPNNQIIATYTQSLDFNRQDVYFVGLNGENFKSTTVEGRGLTYIWSTSGDKLLYSVYNTASNLSPELWIVDAEGDTISNNRQDLGLATWADKCTFADNTTIYCGVPKSLAQGSGIFRSELETKTSDNLYKIDIQNGTEEMIAMPDGSYNVSNIVVDRNQGQLYFSDKTTGKLYTVKLK